MNAEQGEERFRTSVNQIVLEIELFWKRALFFWGFIASAFVAFVSLKNSDSMFTLIIATFGLVCSFIWTLVNRGSKYWVDYWEEKVFQNERYVTGSLFFQPASKGAHQTFFWLRGRRFSVTKLTIALSDYVFALWVGILINEVLTQFDLRVSGEAKTILTIIFLAFSGIFLLGLLCFGRGTDRPPIVEANAEQKEIMSEASEENTEKLESQESS